MKDSSHALALYSNTSLPDALAMSQSDIGDFFDGKVYSDWRKGKEGELKIQAGIADRLNNVIRSIGVLAKSLSFRR